MSMKAVVLGCSDHFYPKVTMPKKSTQLIHYFENEYIVG